MRRTAADKGGTVYSVSDLNSAAEQFANLLLQDDELRRTVISVRHRYARAIKAPDKRLRGKARANPSLLHEAKARDIWANLAEMGALATLPPSLAEQIDRSLQLGIKYESEISEALEVLGVRATWLARFLLIPPSAGLGGPGRVPFLKPKQLPAAIEDVSDSIRLALPRASELPLPDLASLQGQLVVAKDAPLHLAPLPPIGSHNVSVELTYEPAKDERKSIEDSALSKVRQQLDDIDESYRAHYRLTSHPRRRPELARHVRWLYQRLAKKETYSGIARAEGPIDRSTVRRATRGLAKALEIELLKGKPGRPRKLGREG